MSQAIILFAGQGSSLSFDDNGILSTSTAAARFIETCHKSLLAELHSVDPTERSTLEGIINLFPLPSSLTNPAVEDHPVVQGIALYVRQILSFYQYAGDPRAAHSVISESAGFCSGILPAVIASLCPDPESAEFLQIAIAGFRLAFWIGFRVSIFCRNLAGDSAQEFPWSLTIQGLSVSELEELLTAFNRSAQLKLPLRIAAILSDRVISVAGEGKSLHELTSKGLPAHAVFRFANIHGYYHGGERLRPLVEQILEDVQRRDITFRAWDSLHFPVRSAVDGNHIGPGESSKSLLTAVLEQILIQRVDWDTAVDRLVQDSLDKLNRDSRTSLNISAIGPNSRSLLRAIKRRPSHSQLFVAAFEPGSGNGPSPNDIAIVGMSVNYPSGKGPKQLWETLERCLNVVQEIPSSRFEVSDYYDGNTNSKALPRKMDSRHGNFLDDPFAFDNSFFHISPREARSMDPQQRLLLHAALEAMEDAGYAPDSTTSFQRESTGVYVGVATLDYVDNTRNDIDVYYSPGTLRAFLSGRISYAFQFEGPSVVVDTACSSSTIALYQACRALQAGDCTAALAGGVNVISSPDMYLGLSRAHFLSPTGQCKPWDASADGYCRGEGCGMFVLKKLSDAVTERDRIYGIIRGVEVNQCGAAKSITHPDAVTQAKLFRSLLTKTRIDPNSIGVVEAHGTGTQAGDYAEVSSLQAVFGPTRSAKDPLLLSSIKGNIGHSEAASGAAGLVKLLLMMQNKQVPPQAAHHQLNPRLVSMTEQKILVPTKTVEWRTASGVPRRALLNNFGAAGSNAALILEEYIQPFSGTPNSSTRSCHVLNISAKTAHALEELRRGYCAYLKQIRDTSTLPDLCYSANARKQEFDAFRISVSGSSRDEILQKLEQAKCPQRAAPSKGAFITFVFSGQGSIYAGMGAELLSTEPIFRENVQLCNDTLEGLGFPSVDAMLREDSDHLNALDTKHRIVISQCACFVLEYCLAKLWIKLGIVPDVVTGHSLGEYAALAIAGVLSLRDSLLLVAKRAELMAQLCKPDSTGMVACNMAPTRAESLVKDFENLVVSCKNSTTDCVVAGSLTSLTRFVDFCKSSGHKAKLLDVPFGFHSPAMDPILEPFARVLDTVRINSPKIPLVSSYLGRLTQKDDFSVENFIGHTRQPVEFMRAAEVIPVMTGEKELIIIEVGPSPITLPLVKATLQQTDATYLPSLTPKAKPWATMSSTLSSLFLRGVSVRWREVYESLNVKFLDDLPRYPLTPAKFVVPFAETASRMSKQSQASPNSAWRFLDGTRSTSSDGSVFTSKISALAEFIEAHNVGGAALCPASVYIELALEALHLSKPEQGQFQTLVDLTFDKPLVYSESKSSMDLHTRVASDAASFQVFEGDAIYSTGNVATTTDEHIIQDFARRTSYIKRQRESMSFIDCFSTRILYDVIFPRVVAYSGPYVTIKQLIIAPSGLEGVGTFQIPSTGLAGFRCPPAFTDTLLHAAGFIANSKISSDEACICVKVERVTVPAGPESTDQTLYGREMRLYCGLVECFGDSIIGDAYALDKDGSVLACVEGMHFKRLRLKSFQAHLSRAIAPSTKHPQDLLAASTRRMGVRAQEHIYSDRDPDAANSVSHVAPARELGHANIRSMLYSTISEVCGTADADIQASTSLADMGIDSLLTIELTTTLQRQFVALGLSGSDFVHCETVGQIEDTLRRADARQKGGTPPVEQIPDLSMSPSTPASEGSDTPNDLARVNDFFQQVCGFSLHGMDKDITLASLGVDSLLSIELASGLNHTFGVRLDNGSISELSVRELERAVVGYGPEPLKQQEPLGGDYRHTIPEQDTILMSLHKNGNRRNTKPSLYLFHDGSGLCNQYSRLFELDQDVYGVSSVDFSAIDDSITTLEQLASRYIDRLGLAKKDEIVLGGWSFGGVLAYEVSRQLCQRSNTPVRGVILIDSPPPVSHEPLPQAIVSHICERMSVHSPATRRIRLSIEAQFQRNASLLGKYNPRSQPWSGIRKDLRCVMMKCKEVFDAEGLCGVKYPWLSDERARLDSAKVWEDLLGRPIPVLDVSGNHFDLFSPGNVEQVSAQLKKASLMLESVE